jgi:hypothetical protein
MSIPPTNLNNGKYSRYSTGLFLRLGFDNVVCKFRREPYDKAKTRNRILKLQIEEDLPAVCANCRSSVRSVARKAPDNMHYGCIESCCPMLHQWDLCSTCIAIKHLPVVTDEGTRRYEALKFHNVFSKLPDDIKRYVGGFVPNIFNCVRLSKTVISTPALFYLEYRYTTYSKKVWNETMKKVYKDSEWDWSSNGATTRKRMYTYLKDEYEDVCKKDIEVISDTWFFNDLENTIVSNMIRKALKCKDAVNSLDMVDV